MVNVYLTNQGFPASHPIFYQSMITQEQISTILKDLPREFSIDELVDKLILVEKIEEAIKQGERGETYSTEEARELLRQWSR